jgi:hypothetical protein
MKARAILMLAVLAMAVQGCDSASDRAHLAQTIDMVRVGDTRESVVSRLGQPAGAEFVDLFGLRCEVLTWRAGDELYSVKLVAARVVVISKTNLKKQSGTASTGLLQAEANRPSRMVGLS